MMCKDDGHLGTVLQSRATLCMITQYHCNHACKKTDKIFSEGFLFKEETLISFSVSRKGSIIVKYYE